MRTDDTNSIKVGWLQEGQEFPTGSVNPSFIGRLWVLCTCSVNQTRGFHACPFCRRSDPQTPVVVSRNKVTLKLGSAEIRVFSPDGKIYSSPNLIYHYVTEHHYQPPPDFIEAVLLGPIPPSPGYFNQLDELGFKHNRCLGMDDVSLMIKNLLDARKHRKP